MNIKLNMQRNSQIKKMNHVLIGIGLIFSIIIGKLFYEQIFNYENILNKAMNLWQRDFHLSGQRGTIYTSDMEAVAVNMNSTSIVVVPLMIKDKENTALLLSEILECNYSSLLEKISKRVSTQKLQPEGRNISDEQRNKILELNLEGVLLVQDYKRYYPYADYLAQVIGFSGIDHQGLSGLELQYDDVLKAEKGKLQIAFDAKGNLVELSSEVVSQGIGNDVVMTIDSKIQNIMEREMENMFLQYEPKSALALAMNPNTGAILGMVSMPDFDPNHYQDYDNETINRNLPIWMNFEPGSTFKSITFASALEEKCFDMYKDTYYDRGYEMVEGARIKSWKLGGHGQQTFLQVLENSSNPGFVEIGRRLTKDKLYEYIMNFGFGKKTGIDLPGESSGIMFDYDAIGPVEAATMAFGQGLSVTPIQLVRAFCALINGGYLVEPYIVQDVLSPITHESMTSKKIQNHKRIISEETSALMRIALESVVANGGGKNSYIDGYKIGGKTGTAQKVENGVYSSSEYILSFLSGASMDDPQIVLYVAIDSPKNVVQYGGTVAAPVVKAMYEDILPYLNIKQSETQIPKKTTWLDPKMIEINDFIGKTREEVIQKNIQFEFIGEGNTVVDQYPKANTKIEENSKVVIVLA